MIRLNFIFCCTSKQQFVLAEQIFLLGHKVKVITKDLELTELAEDTGIKLCDSLQSINLDAKDIIVSFDQAACKTFTNLHFYLSSSISLENIHIAQNQLFSISWCCFQDSKLYQLGSLKLANSENINAVLEELYKEFIDRILLLSRDGETSNIYFANLYQNSLQLKFEDLETILNNLYSLLASYRQLDNSKIAIADNGYFDADQSVICDIRWITKEVILAANNNSKIKIILAKDEITEDSNHAVISGYLDLDLNLKQIIFKYYDVKYAKFLDHLYNIHINSNCYLNLEEQKNILHDFNCTEKIFNAKQTIDQQFDHISKLYQENIAVIDEDGECSYSQLSQLSQHVSQFLLKNYDMVPEKKVIISLPKSRYLLALILGILRINACYIPIPISYPIKRLMNILDETGAEIVICSKEFFDANYEALKSLKVILLDDIFNQQLTNSEIKSRCHPNSLAYIIFTSGSTGKPKGVMIEHHSVVNLSQTEAVFCSIDTNSKLLSVASIGFDALGWDIYGALLNGATVCLASDDIQKYPEELTQYIEKKGITIATLTPAILSLLPKHQLVSLKSIIVMGDRSNKKLMNEWSENFLLVNGYGPTEATIGATLCQYHHMISESCIGKPMHNYKIYILDQDLRPVPTNIPGELCIAGIGIARGYINNELMNNEKFVHLKLPHQEAPIRIYKTGDLAIWRDDGMLEFLGRIDRQVKVRGVRIEIGEVEALINDHPMVKESLVISWGNNDNKKLVAYIIINQDYQYLGSFQITKSIRDRLGDFVHPAALPDSFTIVSSFPVNINGKIDLTALPTPEFLTMSDIIETRSYEEEEIKQIFIEVIGHENIGIFESFIDLGGHSLTATQICARVNQKFDLNLSTRDIFENMTIASLASLIQTKNKIAATEEIKIQPIRKGPLANAQERLWYLYQLDREDTSYNLPLAIRMIGALNYDILSQALTYIAERHETFRIVFGIEKGVPYQMALASKKISVVPQLIESKLLHDDMTKLCRQPFILEDTPPIRIILYQINEHEHVLLFIKHNIITDAWSEGVIIKELFYIYQQLQSGINSISLPKLPYQLIDIATHCKNHAGASTLRVNALQFWKDNFTEYEEFEFPSDYQRPEIIMHKGQRICYNFTVNSWQELSAFAKSQSCTMFMVILAILKILIYKYTNTNDITLGTALAGRDKLDLENITGFFVNTLPIRTKFSSSMTFQQLLQVVKGNCLDVYKYQNIEFEQIVEQIDFVRSPNKNPLFQIMTILQNADEERLPSVNNLLSEKLNVVTGAAMFDMVWNFRESNNMLSLNLDFSTELYKESTIWKLIKNYEQIMSAILGNADLPISNIQSITTTELKFIDFHTNGDKTAINHLTIVEWLDQVCLLNAENVAIETSDISISYKQLNDISATLSRHLVIILEKHSGAKRIGILMSRSHYLAIAIYGVLKAGYCYIPLDPDYPKERLRYMIEDADLDAIITEQDLLPIAKSISTKDQLRFVDIKSAVSLNNNEPAVTAYNFHQINQNSLAYILYTSGSTGNPKGVMITHINLVNFCQDMLRRLKFKCSDIFMSITTISFDIFGLEYLCTLLSGAKLFLCSQEIARNPVSLANLFNELQPSKMQATPTMWSIIIDHIFPTKELTIMCGGEYLSKSLLEKFQKKNTYLQPTVTNNHLALEDDIIKKGARITIWNLYGPTETTIWSSAADLTNSPYVHICLPIDNTVFHILDNDLSRVPVGVYGKLFISGLGVAQGYWNKEDLTHKQFILYNNQVLYNTGDLVKLDEQGNIVCGGRTDYQVKIRGNRIELGDIEYHLLLHDQVKDVVCRIVKNNGDSIIAAYIIPKLYNIQLNIDELREFLEGKIQASAIPSAFVILEKFPLTYNNKIDRNRLPPINQTHAFSQACYAAPMNDIEIAIQKIWCEVLKVKEISVEENFFSLGGNSLHIPQIISILNDRFNTSITIRNFILNSTIRALASMINN